MNNLLAWGYVLLAAILETFWTYSLKYLNFGEIKQIKWRHFNSQHVQLLLPLGGYILFGIANVYFLSLAMRTLSVTTAFTTWMALSVVLLKVADVLFFNDHLAWPESFCLLLIVIGVTGLRFYTKPV